MKSLNLTVPSGASIEIRLVMTPKMEGQITAWMEAHGAGDEEE